jgi:hypothetical protein
MNKYMLLLYGNMNNKLDNLPKERVSEIHQKFGEWVKKMISQERFIGGDALTEKRKFIRDGQIKDGPYTEAKEVMNGYFIIKAKNLDEAIRISEDHPSFLYGGIVEVVEMMGLK